MTENAALRLADIAASPAHVRERAEALLVELGRHIPFDASWIALAEPDGVRYTSLASTSLDESTLRYLSGPRMAADIELSGADRARPPFSGADLPYPLEELQTWADCLLPAGFHQALSVALFGPGMGRHVGFVTLLFRREESPTAVVRRALSRLLPTLTLGIDPVRSMAAAALLVRGSDAGVVLLPGRIGIGLIPGLPGHALFAAGSELLSSARAVIDEGQTYASFLWPWGGRHAPGGHVRVTVMGGDDGLRAVLTGIVVLSPAGDLRGLTPRELEVLGLVIDGRSNNEIAHELVVATRTVAAHMEHILAKLQAGSRTLAAIRAERAGLYVPAPRPRPA
ncbi:response regulator transcription factor [Planctomonas deserti]|uniref:response regulator transcription factor n=1 Tax=Planctomonas deserti TaxID=2144185 RepID=UPI000D3973A9|nr:helix-turn-helix transcriptional regulator [Planctomonas deserti]